MGRSGKLFSKDIGYIHAQHQKRISTGKVTEENGIVICLDVLGWKNYDRPNQIENLTVLTANLESTILDGVLRITDDVDNCKVDIINLSDTIFIFISDNSPYFFINVFKALAKFVNDAFRYSFAFRGAVSYGNYQHNEARNIFTGDAVYEAATYCESTEWAGIIITDSLSTALLENNDYSILERIHLIKYENIPYKENFLKKHSKCKDCLVLNPNSIAVGPLGEYIIDEKLENKYLDYFSKNTGIVPDDLIQKYQNTVNFIEFVKKFSHLTVQ